MKKNECLSLIKSELFFGSTDYTKNQPDLFVPHKFQWIAPSQVSEFLDTLKQKMVASEILVYVHLPFCFSECLFCNAFPQKADKVQQEHYLQSLLTEIDLLADAGLLVGKTARCIYFGGGTPTLFSNEQIERILTKIKSHMALSEHCNISCEAHPATLSNNDRIRHMAALGINRISTGCQTFDPDLLKRCNRSHTQAQIHSIVDSAQQAGMTINVDMMTGLPGQTLESVNNDLLVLDELKPNAIEYIRHEIVNPLVISLYRDNPDLVVDNEDLFEMVYLTQAWMEQHGYEQNGRYSKTDQWEYRYHWLNEMPILAFGARSRSYTKTLCFDKHEDLSMYMRSIEKGIPPAIRSITLGKKDQMYRSLILSLQLKRGLDIHQFQQRFQEDPLEVFCHLIKKLTAFGCLEVSKDSLHLSQVGAYFVEDVCDMITDAALKAESEDLVREPHSTGRTSERL